MTVSFVPFMRYGIMTAPNLIGADGRVRHASYLNSLDSLHRLSYAVASALRVHGKPVVVSSQRTEESFGAGYQREPFDRKGESL